MADSKTRAEVISAVAKDAATAMKEVVLALPVVAILIALFWFEQDLNELLDRYGITELGPIKRQIKANDETILKLNGRLSEAYARLEESSKLLKDIGSPDATLRKDVDQQLARNGAQLSLRLDTQKTAQRQFEQNTKTIQSLERKEATGDLNWAIVFAGDRTRKEAEHEIKKAQKADQAVYLAAYARQAVFRSVAQFKSREDAAKTLPRLQQINQGAYIVNLATWCPNRREKAGADAEHQFPLFEC